MRAFLSRERKKPPPKLALEIFRYFCRNPQACDDVEGVARWRLADEKIYETLQTTEKALEWLVSRGLLVKESKPWCGDMYRMNAQMQEKTAPLGTEEARPKSDLDEK